MAQNNETTRPYQVIDDTESLTALIPTLCNLPTSPPSLYFDIEGVNLSRHGSISIIQLYVLPLQVTYLFDVHVLGSAIFTTETDAAVSTRSLKAILESPSIPKCFFDIRHDSDALYNLFSISVQGIQDIQVMEFATRLGRARFVNGLARCITADAGLSTTDSVAFERCKQEGVKLFKPELGGSYEVFNVRPLEHKILNYCVQDVVYLPVLWQVYNAKIGARMQARVVAETKRRVEMTKRADYRGFGRNMALGPW